jgi:hypothetical protein
MTDVKEAPTDLVASAEPEKQKKAEPESPVPELITTASEYERAYKYLSQRYHVLSPISGFSGIAPQHGLMVAKVLIDSDPEHGEVYQDKLFCKSNQKDKLDDEVALTKVGLRKLCLAGGMNLDPELLKAEPNYWVIRATNSFKGLDGATQRFTATVEYDLRDGSPQIRNMTPKQVESARSHGLRGGEARALNAAVREFGVRQKYTRRELQKAFVMMRMLFIPDASNEMQMRIVTERALGGTHALYPQSQPAMPLPVLEPIGGMGQPVSVGGSATIDHAPQADDLGLPQGYVLIREIKEKQIPKRDKSGTFPKWTVVDSAGAESVTVKRDIVKGLELCWNKADWRQGRPVEIVTTTNAYRDQEITEVNPLPESSDDEPA